MSDIQKYDEKKGLIFWGMLFCEGCLICFNLFKHIDNLKISLSNSALIIFSFFLILTLVSAILCLTSLYSQAKLNKNIYKCFQGNCYSIITIFIWGMLLVLWLIQVANPSIWSISRSFQLLFFISLWIGLGCLQGRVIFSHNKYGELFQRFISMTPAIAAGLALAVSLTGIFVYFTNQTVRETAWIGIVLLVFVLVYIFSIISWVKKQHFSLIREKENLSRDIIDGFFAGCGLTWFFLASFVPYFLPEVTILSQTGSILGAAFLAGIFERHILSHPLSTEISERNNGLWIVRILVMLAGIACLSIAVVGSKPVMPRLELIVVGLILLGGGILGKASLTAYRNGGLILLNTLLFLILFDLILFAANFPWRITENKIDNFLQDRNITSEPESGKEIWISADLPYYQESSWGKTYWDELDAMDERGFQYKPFAVWKHFPVQGEMITMLDGGDIRKTVGAKCGNDSYRIFMFGGSTLWGLGSPDWGTISSYLQDELNRHKTSDYCVVNFGMNAYASTQEVIALYLEILEDNIPDMVIFYDGVNDVYIPYLNGAPPQTHYNLESVKTKLEKNEADETKADSSSTDTSSVPYNFFYEDLTTVQTIRQVRTATNTITLSKDIVRIYFENAKIVREFSEMYDFDVYFFWGPVLFYGNKPMTQDEILYIDNVFNDEPETIYLVDLYNYVYTQVIEDGNTYPDFYSLAHIFDEETQMLFIDLSHIIPEGNQMVAKNIFQTIESDLPE